MNSWLVRTWKDIHAIMREAKFSSLDNVTLCILINISYPWQRITRYVMHILFFCICIYWYIEFLKFHFDGVYNVSWNLWSQTSFLHEIATIFRSKSISQKEKKKFFFFSSACRELREFKVRWIFFSRKINLLHEKRALENWKIETSLERMTHDIMICEKKKNSRFLTFLLWNILFDNYWVILNWHV